MVLGRDISQMTPEERLAWEARVAALPRRTCYYGADKQEAPPPTHSPDLNRPSESIGAVALTGVAR